MNVCIIGWYGTETLGDRAILNGIVNLLDLKFGPCKKYLASLYPFYTERCLLEDYKNYNPNIDIFDFKNTSDLRETIKKSDIVIMGGGPLMDIAEVSLIKKAFLLGRKYRKRNVLFGVGIGPLNSRIFLGFVKDILKLSDVSVFRDSNSYNLAKKINPNGKYIVGFDPAVISIINHRIVGNKKNCLVLNLRTLTSEYKAGYGLQMKDVIKLVDKASEIYDYVEMVPMHTFFIGGDDRNLLNVLAKKCKSDNVIVDFKPLGLSEIYDVYINAKACIGMRYHSVVMQTLLNGNNYIIDYTDPITGKIQSFINDLNISEFYSDRYYSCVKDIEFRIDKCLEVLERGERLEISSDAFDMNILLETL